MQDIGIQLEQITEELLQDSAEIIAATAQEYFRDSFRRKAFKGKRNAHFLSQGITFASGNTRGH